VLPSCTAPRLHVTATDCYSTHRYDVTAAAAAAAGSTRGHDGRGQVTPRSIGHVGRGDEVTAGVLSLCRDEQLSDDLDS